MYQNYIIHPAHHSIRASSRKLRHRNKTITEIKEEIPLTNKQKTITEIKEEIPLTNKQKTITIIGINIIIFLIFFLVFIKISQKFKIKYIHNDYKEIQKQENSNVFRSGNFRNLNSASKTNEHNMPSVVSSSGTALLMGLVYGAVVKNKYQTDKNNEKNYNE